MEINLQTSKNATHCVKNKVCLKKPENLCPVLCEVANGMLVVLKRSPEKCEHHVHFGYNGFCNCPVRKDIYRKYKK